MAKSVLLPSRFQSLFTSWAGRVRRRLTLRAALTGTAIGLAVALVPAGLAWKTRHGQWRPIAASLGGVGLIAGLVASRRKRWSDGDVALYLDGQLKAEEAISTAVELREDAPAPDSGDEDAAKAVVVTSATAALEAGKARDARPAIFKPIHALIPLAAAGLVFVARAPLPPGPAVVATPGTTLVQMNEVDGLEQSIKLAQLSARDDAQRERLDKIAKDAEKLKEELNKGIEKRDAQDKIARLKEQIAAERLTLGEGEKRQGLESAVNKLNESDLTKDAAKDLGDHDLTSLDEQMEKLANEREKADRELAKKKLEEAADAANKNGAPDVAKSLTDEKKSMEDREKRSGMLRDLADAMKSEGMESSDVQNKSEALDRESTDKAAKQLADAMGKALEKLTPEQRKKLADKLKQEGAQGGAAQQGDPQSLKDMADDLSTPEGQKKLEDQLKDLANQDDESAESKRQKALDDAQNGAEGTEKDLGKQGQGQGQQGQQGQGQQGQGQQGQGQQGQGQQGQQGQGQGQGGIPIPSQGQGQNGQGQNGQSGQGGDAQNGSPGPGSHHDTGTGNHSGSTAAVDAQTLKSRAQGHINKNQAMPGAVNTFVPGKAGGTANTRGTGDLQIVGPNEVDGVERSDVPQEYREHVRQYFQP